ncbi:hypothetical protein AGMMS49982_00760 [Bacteroidia bacterium]|nr:hypothetical protein AGMMS49982_00760 [Bacteroidia bacterium]
MVATSSCSEDSVFSTSTEEFLGVWTDNTAGSTDSKFTSVVYTLTFPTGGATCTLSATGLQDLVEGNLYTFSVKRLGTSITLFLNDSVVPVSTGTYSNGKIILTNATSFITDAIPEKFTFTK